MHMENNNYSNLVDLFEKNHKPNLIFYFSGIGEALALCFARKSYSLILVARNKTKLQQVAEQCQQLNQQTPLIIVADLAEKNAASPGATLTGFRKNIMSKEKPSLFTMSVNEVAELAYAQIEKKAVVYIPGFINRLFVFITKLLYQLNNYSALCIGWCIKCEAIKN